MKNNECTKSNVRKRLRYYGFDLDEFGERFFILDRRTGRDLDVINGDEIPVPLEYIYDWIEAYEKYGEPFLEGSKW